MIWTKGTHRRAEFETFDCSRENSPNLYFHRLLLLKAYKISAKKSIEDPCLMTLNSDVKFKAKLICCFKNGKNLVNFNLSTRNSQNFFFDWFLVCKVFSAWEDTEESCFMTLMSDTQIEEKLTCVLENDMSNMADFHQSTWKSENSNWDVDRTL